MYDHRRVCYYAMFHIINVTSKFIALIFKVRCRMYLTLFIVSFEYISLNRHCTDQLSVLVGNPKCKNSGKPVKTKIKVVKMSNFFRPWVEARPAVPVHRRVMLPLNNNMQVRNYLFMDDS